MTMQLKDSLNQQPTGAEKAKEVDNPLEKALQRAKRAEVYSARRNIRGHKTEVIIRSTGRKKKLPKTYQGEVAYDFLANYRIIFKWATVTHNLRKSDLELMLYLLPVKLFKKSDFSIFHQILGIYHGITFKRLMDEGWLTVWRPRKGNESALYTLSPKAKRLCSEIHRMCVGELKIPENIKSNKLADSKEKVIHKFYMNAIKNMNKKAKEKPLEN